MAISVLYNIPSLAAENQLKVTNMDLQNTLYQLSTGSRINSGADDAAGLAIANGLGANVTALTQSGLNATEGADKLQVADGALSQVTTLLNRAVTLATEASNGTMNTSQIAAANAEYTNILGEIDNINTNTEYNGINVFSTAANIFTSDGTLTQTDAATALGSVVTQVNLSGDLTTAANAQAELANITAAISAIARLLTYMATSAALPVLRRKMPGVQRWFMVPGGAVIPVAAIAISLWLLMGSTKNQITISGATLLAGAVAYSCHRLIRRS